VRENELEGDWRDPLFSASRTAVGTVTNEAHPLDGDPDD